MEVAARQYLDACRAIEPRNVVAVAMEEVAAARRLTGRASEALSAANACIEFHYEAVGCHAEKALALAQLKLNREARDVVESGRQVGARELERARRDMDGSGMRRHERTAADAQARIRTGALRESLAKRGLERLAAVSALLTQSEAR